MVNLIICVGMFYILHLFLTMSFSLHKVPFINWTHTGGDISGMTDLSSRMASASDNLRQSLPIFMTFAVLSVVMSVDNLMLAKYWFGLDRYHAIELEEIKDNLVNSNSVFINDELVESSLTLLQNYESILPLKNLDTLKIASLSIGDQSNSFQDMLSNYWFWKNNSIF